MRVGTRPAPRQAAVAIPAYPYRVAFIAAEGLVAVAAVVGAAQLMSGTFTPPVADIARLGLSSWVLPGLWLLASVAVPSAVASWMAWWRSPLAPQAVLWASALLVVELAVQIPFVGLSPLQAVLAAVAVALAAAAVRSRRLGWRRDSRRSSPTGFSVVAGTQSTAGVHLLWIPLGSGASVPLVRWNGRAYEAISAFAEHRHPQDLYHAALELGTSHGRFVIEMTPAWGTVHSSRGSVTSGPVGWRPLGRSRFFRYEIHCWRDGVIPDREQAVGGPIRLTGEVEIADTIVTLVPSVPANVWGRDERGTGDMWNSNSLVAWLLAESGLRTDEIHPPHNGRAPGWQAGLTLAAAHHPAEPA